MVATEAPVGPASEKLDRRVYVVLAGLLLAMLLASLDNLIVGTAMPRIVGELGGIKRLSWVVTAYLLTMTVSGPFYGKFGDLYGRKKIFMSAIVIFLVASVLLGLSQNMAELIGFRALQGLGAGGIVVGVLAIIGDLVPPRERGRLMGFAAPVIGVATIGGPLLGGFLTDHLSWRWIFYINLPPGIMALALIATTLHLPHHKIKHKIDWLGAVLLIVAASALMLVRSWGGSHYGWGSWQIIGLAVISVVSTLLFVLVERRAPEPMLPFRLFRNRNFSVAVWHGFLIGFAMFGAVAFLPLYQQTVQGASATNSGILLLPMMFPMFIIGPLVGQVISRTGRYKIFQILGGAVLTVGMYLLTRLDVSTTKLTSGAYMVVFGIGMAMSMQLTMLIAQNSAEQRDMGVASSTSNFFRLIGGAFGVSLFGAIFNNRLAAALSGMPGAGVLPAGGGAKLDPGSLSKVAPQVKGPLLAAIADAIHNVFWWGLPFTALVFVIGWVLKEVPLRTSAGRAGEHLSSEVPE
ncbi:MDR family MFS transporter [Actinoallomurus sp. CA-150999]|uniref:MDR family MFS transporter n=1 Tax=Actinoallomurus sp. CA-150999 TaxID=3239887 RepID=UPI003D93C087